MPLLRALLPVLRTASGVAMTWEPCTHKTMTDHVTGKSDDGRNLWRCSNCGAVDVWGDTWGYHGNVECPTCWTAAIDSVACSKSCAEALAAANPSLRPAGKAPTATRTTTATGDAPKRPPSNRGIHAEARKRKALAALDRLTPEALAEVLDAVKRKGKR